MSEALPSYFTRLEPFRDFFRGRIPILTYHKFGERPRGVRLRGLYLPVDLFSRQLRELRDGGFSSKPLATVLEGAPPSELPSGPEAGPVVGPARPVEVQGVVLTIDDGFQSVHREAMPLLARWGYRATLYLVSDRLGGWNDWEMQQGEARARIMDVSEVREWMAAGHAIGSHTRTHPWLTRIPMETAREEIGASRRRLEDLLGVEVNDFCYPYGDWNPAVRDMVREAGYRTATITDFGLNGAGSDPWALKRITARHASRGMRGLRGWWRRLLGQP